MQFLPRTALFLFGMLVLAAPASAAPDPEKTAASSDAQKAAAAVAAKRFRAAADLYESAYKHVPDPKYLFGEASAFQKNGDLARAATLYTRYLKEASEKAASRDKARKELDALTAKLGQLAIKADGASQVTVDGDLLDAPLPPTVFVSPGLHQIEAKFADKSVTQPATATAGAVANITLALPVEAPVKPPVAVVAPPPPPPKTVAEAKRKPLPPLVVYIGAGAAVIAGGLTVLSALDTSSQKKTFDADRTQENLDAGKDKQLRTNVLLGVTGGLVVLTGVAAIFLVDWKGKSGDAVKVGVGPGSLLLQSTF